MEAMSLTAITPAGKTIICDDYESKEAMLIAHPEGFFSPYCMSPVPIFPVWGNIRQPHFRHPPTFQADYEHHPESMEHLAGKKWVRAKLAADPAYQKMRIVYERRITLLSGKNRIIDVAVMAGDRVIEAHEIQLSAQTREQLEQRNYDYISMGIQPEWYFGGDCLNIGKRWQADCFGYVNPMTFSIREVRTAI